MHFSISSVQKKLTFSEPTLDLFADADDDEEDEESDNKVTFSVVLNFWPSTWDEKKLIDTCVETIGANFLPHGVEQSALTNPQKLHEHLKAFMQEMVNNGSVLLFKSNQGFISLFSFFIFFFFFISLLLLFLII